MLAADRAGRSKAGPTRRPRRATAWVAAPRVSTGDFLRNGPPCHHSGKTAGQFAHGRNRRAGCSSPPARRSRWPRGEPGAGTQAGIVPLRPPRRGPGEDDRLPGRGHHRRDETGRQRPAAVERHFQHARGSAVRVLPPQEVAHAVGDEGVAEPPRPLQLMRMRSDDNAGALAAASSGASASWFASGHAWPSVPQCMNTTTILARLLAARTAARVRGRFIAFASPGRVSVATQDEASSATWDTPMMAIGVPFMVVTYGAHAAAASVPIPTYGNLAARPRPACRPGRLGRSQVRGCWPW